MHRVADIDIDIDILITQALQAMQYAYIPYSGFPVGASVVDDQGRHYSGCNIENASYGLACCAERTTIFSAVAKGAKHIVALCVAGNTTEAISPCGACRQVLREFAHKDILIILSNSTRVRKIISMEDLLPYSFGPEHLTQKQ